MLPDYQVEKLAITQIESESEATIYRGVIPKLAPESEVEVMIQLSQRESQE